MKIYEEPSEVLKFYERMYKLIVKEPFCNILKLFLVMAVWFGGKGFVMLCATAPPSVLIYTIYKQDRNIRVENQSVKSMDDIQEKSKDHVQ